MASITDNLNEIARELEKIAKRCDTPAIEKSLDALTEACNELHKAHSGSWIGYQSVVYFQDFQMPPPGATFRSDRGTGSGPYLEDTQGGWVEYNGDEVYEMLTKVAKKPTLAEIGKIAGEALEKCEEHREQIISTLDACLATGEDVYLSKMKKNAEEAKWYKPEKFVGKYAPQGARPCHDMRAMSGGMQCPPHIQLLARLDSLKAALYVPERLAKIAKRVASHLAKRENAKYLVSPKPGTKVFLGHGRSLIWRELKDFIEDRLDLEADEFNRVPVAGITNIARLSQMLNDAAIAFVIMTAEDQQVDGTYRARENVVHEAGLFQGKLGFTKAIVLLEEGCEPFSNIDGLGQIRFPKGKIKAAFDEVRQVLEREGLIEA